MAQNAKKPNISEQIQIAVLNSSGPAMLMVDSVVRSRRYAISVFSDPHELETYIKINIPALVILPMTLREDLIRVVPIVRTAMQMRSFSQVKFLAISDLVQKLGDHPAAQNTIQMLQGLMDFVPLKFSGEDLSRKIDEQLQEFKQELVDVRKSNEFFFLRGKESPQNFGEVIEAYSQGIRMIGRMISASECALLTMDPITQKYKVVQSTNSAHSDSDWELKAPNIIPRRDIVSSRGYFYFQPVKSYLVNEAEERSFGFIYILREKAKTPLNTDQASLIYALAKEIEGLSQAYGESRDKV